MTNKLKLFWISYMKDILMIILGTTIMSIGITGFYSQAKITPSGLYGLLTIFTDVILNKPKQLTLRLIAGLLYILINFIALAIIYKKMGKKFAINTIVAIINYIGLNVLLQYTPLSEFIYNNLVSSAMPISTNGNLSYAPEYGILCSIFGGVLMGIGLGLVFRSNGSTGGCDLLAMVINKINPSITPGQIMTAVDATVVISCFGFYNIKASLYALIGIYLCNHVADMILDGVTSLRAYFIITEKPEEVSNIIMNNVKRGVTNIKCEGMYSKQNKSMLLSIVKKNQMYLLKQVVKAYDPHSFMFSVSAKEAYGLGFVSFDQNSTDLAMKKLEKMLDKNSSIEEILSSPNKVKNSNNNKENKD